MTERQNELERNHSHHHQKSRERLTQELAALYDSHIIVDYEFWFLQLHRAYFRKFSYSSIAFGERFGDEKHYRDFWWETCDNVTRFFWTRRRTGVLGVSRGSSCFHGVATKD